MVIPEEDKRRGSETRERERDSCGAEVTNRGGPYHLLK